jgi:hypothetical protein
VTRKHFEAIAAIVKARLDWLDGLRYPRSDHAMGFDTGYRAGIEATVAQMADYFETQNPNFDRARFLRACGMDQS